MTDEERELVEEMAEKVCGSYWNTVMTATDKEIEIGIATKMLSVVKANLGKICKMCDCIEGSDEFTSRANNDCPKCHGTGIVPKGNSHE